MLRTCSILAIGVLLVSGSLATPAAAQPLFAEGRDDLVREGPTAVAPAISDQERPDADLHTAAVGPAMRPLVPQFNAIWPTQGQITTYFGEVGPTSPRGHSGLDIAAPWGTPVDAADDGEVLKAYWDGQGYGGLVIIGHPSGYETWYGHLAKFEVAKGDVVKRGDEIGLMGSTGYSTGPHLHFEVREDGQVMDPLEFLNEATLKDVKR